MLFNFLLGKSLIELCFSCFTVNNWLDLREAAVARGSSIVMLDEATPTGEDHSRVNAGIERLALITAVVINPVPMPFEIIAKRFIFAANFSF